MTLIINEIHLLDGLKDTLLVAAADQLITVDGNPVRTAKKLFRIPYLDATVSYYGLAEIPQGARVQTMSAFLPVFIRKNAGVVGTLGDFTVSLRGELTKRIPQSLLAKNPSGFHICGYGKGALPELWHLTNIGKMENFRYRDFQSSYFDPSESFLARDALDEFGWEKGTLRTEINGRQTYRNGDIRAHVVIYEMLDNLMKKLFAFNDFPEPQSEEEYGSYCKLKFEVISLIYKKWAENQIIGQPIDVFVMRCEVNETGEREVASFTI